LLGINDLSFHAGAAYGDTEKSFVTLTAVVNVKKTFLGEYAREFVTGKLVLPGLTFTRKVGAYSSGARFSCWVVFPSKLGS